MTDSDSISWLLGWSCSYQLSLFLSCVLPLNLDPFHAPFGTLHPSEKKGQKSLPEFAFARKRNEEAGTQITVLQLTDESQGPFHIPMVVWHREICLSSISLQNSGLVLHSFPTNTGSGRLFALASQRVRKPKVESQVQRTQERKRRGIGKTASRSGNLRCSHHQALGSNGNSAAEQTLKPQIWELLWVSPYFFFFLSLYFIFFLENFDPFFNFYFFYYFHFTILYWVLPLTWIHRRCMRSKHEPLPSP